jgi:hypothetical protein
MQVNELQPRGWTRRWEIFEDGKPIGWVQTLKIGRSSVVFYQLTGVHPVTGEHVTLEASADFDERLEALRRLREHPELSPHYHLLGPGR